jgi:hypothetical protein
MTGEAIVASNSARSWLFMSDGPSLFRQTYAVLLESQ